jgi:hypothetical protein
MPFWHDTLDMKKRGRHKFFPELVIIRSSLVYVFHHWWKSLTDTVVFPALRTWAHFESLGLLLIRAPILRYYLSNGLEGQRKTTKKSE